jgi:parallel beta-helix repeat protein
MKGGKIMLRRLSVILVTVITLQVEMVGILPITASYGSYANPVQHRDGDWVVTSTESVENTSIILNGNLIVESGGFLSLTNVLLRMEQSPSGAYQILANPGSSLIISKSTIEPLQENYQFGISIKGANFALTESTLNGPGIPPAIYALTISDTNGATLKGNSINYANAITLSNSTNAMIDDNTITSIGPDFPSTAIWLDDSHNNTITNNRLYRHSVSIMLRNSWDNYIGYNELTLGRDPNGICITWSSGNNIIAHNHFSMHQGYEGQG